ncbi:Gldg family protein [Filimonas effusa]|uniref:ABC transporter n=1 Tax=Filimonas effusa TaxID=2508721 RepID=A0A4Q1D7Y1_9BACT|nr:Gldg family protein [Filimonas effusa]RXK85414.1 ABC transporter [Filimonas effusa]
MKTTLSVARTELRILFYSPIAWFVLVVFLVQSGTVYFGLIQNIASQQEMGGFRLHFIKELMSRVFTGKGGLFKSIMNNLYLYIPLLTMGLISRETSSGTIRLLYSSPIKVREIILGKYLAMMLYSLFLLAIVGIFITTGIFQIQAPDKGMLMAGLLGFYLLLCAYSAIGLFMSCLTTYQLVAAVCTFVMIAFLNYVGTIGQGMDFVRDITYLLSLSGRTENMLNGLITTKDTVYFLAIIYMFLGLSIYKIKSGMESKPAIVKIGRYSAVIVTGIVAGYIGALPGMIGYYDATINQKNTVAPNVQKIVKELGKEPLEVYTYNNVIGGASMMGFDNAYNIVASTWERYTRFKEHHNIIIHKAVNYYDSTIDDQGTLRSYPGKTLKEIAIQVTKPNGVSMKKVLSPEEIRKIIDLRPELNRFVMQLKYKDKSTFLRIYDDQFVWPGDTEVAAAFKRLLQAKLPRIAFLTGNLERDIFKKSEREYNKIAAAKGFRYALINQGFDVDTVSLEGRDVPDGVNTLVIGDPRLAFTPAVLERIIRYINKGGNLLITCEPESREVLQPLLDELGVAQMEGKLIESDKDFAPDMIKPLFTAKAGSFSGYIEKMRTDSLADLMQMPGVSGLTYKQGGDFIIEPLLLSNPKQTWNRKKPFNAESANTIRPADGIATAGGSIPTDPRQRFSPVSFSAEDGDIKGPIAAALALTRKKDGKEQRIIITGDADFMRNGSFSNSNFFFSTGIFSWLSYGEFPIDSYRAETNDKAVKVTTDEVSYLKIIYLWVLPGILVAFAAILLIRRKRK